MEFWKELRKENMHRILVKIMNNIYETECPSSLEDEYVTHDIQGEGGQGKASEL
jgi:hypothetical protein